MHRALYAGSFDPVHRGHLSIIEAAADVFDEVVVAVMINAAKADRLLPVTMRVELLTASTAHLPDLRVVAHDGLTVDAARAAGASVLVRSAHKEAGNERSMAHTNHRVAGLRTAFLLGDPATEWMSSTVVRELLGSGRFDTVRTMVPPVVFAALVLETGRMVLRPIRFGDVDLLVELDSDPEVMRYLTGGRPSHRAEVEMVVRGSIGHRWIAYDRGTGAVVGWFGIRPSVEHELELGYRLRRDAWGRGLATEGSRALIDLAFRSRGARRVFAQTMAVNVRSRRVMERCGMRFVRTFHLQWDDPIPGTEEGEVEYEILPHEHMGSGSSGA